MRRSPPLAMRRSPPLAMRRSPSLAMRRSAPLATRRSGSLATRRSAILPLAVLALSFAAAACTPAERGDGRPVQLVPPLRIAESQSLAALAGRQWVLREWRAGERFEGKPAVTLGYTEGRLIGRAGCNRYTADVKPGAMPGNLLVGPIAATRMMCPQSVMAVESRFLDALAAAQRWALLASGDLALTYATERGEATLVFSEVRAVRSD